MLRKEVNMHTRSHRMHTFHFSALIITIVSVGVQSLVFDCDKVNQFNECLCLPGDDFGWDIQCPSKLLQNYPISLKLIPSENSEDATLRIFCNPSRDDFEWPLVKGVTIGGKNVSFTVKTMEIFYCPVISTEEFQIFMHMLSYDLGQLEHFTFKSLTHNMSYTFPEDFFQAMPVVEFLNLQSNKLQVMPNLDGLRRLQGLNLRNNHISSIPRGTFSTNGHLVNIGLSGNRISSIDSAVFPQSLEYLDLIKNQVKVITNHTFSNLKHLQHLFLSKNPLQFIDTHAFQNLGKLVELHVDYSKGLPYFPGIRRLPHLTNLSISHLTFTKNNPGDKNEMENIFTTEENTNSPVASNEIIFFEMDSTETSPESSEASFEDKTSPPLTYYYSFEHSEESDDIVLEDLEKLTLLVLTNNGLRSLPSIGRLPSVNTIILSRNRIKSVPEEFFEKLPSLKFCDLSQNLIADLGNVKAPQLTYLDLSYNQIQVIEKHTFTELRHLEKLKMSHNKIEFIDNLAFENLVELKDVDLSSNRISFTSHIPRIPPSSSSMERSGWLMMPEDDSQSPLKYCHKLQKINLKNNMLSKLYQDWNYVHTELMSLDLSYNKIRSLHPKDILFLSKNVQLDLRNNSISTIDMEFADMLLDANESQSINVLLGGNSLHCDCHSLSLKTFMVKSYHLDLQNITCNSPIYLEGMSFEKVSPRDLVCEVEENCPEKCACFEVPSENLVQVDCSNSVATQLPTLDSFLAQHEQSDVDVNFAYKDIAAINWTYMQSLTPQLRLVDLTGNNLTDLSFLTHILESNNVTQFALSGNPFVCDGCEFQRIWWYYYQRISDIENVTCLGGSGRHQLTFMEMVKDTACLEEILTTELRYLIIIIGICIPLALLLIIICSRRQRAKALQNNKVSPAPSSEYPQMNPHHSFEHNHAHSKLKRIPVTELDVTKF